MAEANLLQSDAPMMAGSADTNSFRGAEKETPRRTSQPFRGPSQTGNHEQDKRSAILMDAIRYFSQLSRPGSEDIEKFRALFYQFIESLGEDQKRLASAMLARSPYTPRQIAYFLALEAPHIAAPFLLFSPVLGELDLKAVALKRGSTHSSIIRKRMIPAAKVDPVPKPETKETAGAEKAEPSLPARDEEAEIISASNAGSEKQEVTQPVPETPPAETKSGNERVSDKLGAQHLSGEEIMALASSGGKLGRGKLQGEPVETGRFAFAEPSKDDKSTAPHSETKTKKTIIADIPTGGQTTISELDKQNTRELLLMARHRNTIGIARLIETLCGLPFNTSLKLLTAEKGNELLYLIRAIGVPYPQDMRFALMAMPRIGRNHDEYRNAKSLLADLDQGVCQMIFNEIGATFRIRPKSSDLADSEQPDAFQNAVANRRQMLSPDRREGAEESSKVDHAGYPGTTKSSILKSGDDLLRA